MKFCHCVIPLTNFEACKTCGNRNESYPEFTLPPRTVDTYTTTTGLKYNNEEVIEKCEKLKELYQFIPDKTWTTTNGVIK